jgi:hypothetical protein
LCFTQFNKACCIIIELHFFFLINIGTLFYLTTIDSHFQSAGFPFEIQITHPLVPNGLGCQFFMSVLQSISFFIGASRVLYSAYVISVVVNSNTSCLIRLF